MQRVEWGDGGVCVVVERWGEDSGGDGEPGREYPGLLIHLWSYGTGLLYLQESWGCQKGPTGWMTEE